MSPRSDTIKSLKISLFVVTGAKVMACLFVLSACTGCLAKAVLPVSHRTLVRCPRMQGRSLQAPCPPVPLHGVWCDYVGWCFRARLNRSCGFSNEGICGGINRIPFVGFSSLARSGHLKLHSFMQILRQLARRYWAVANNSITINSPSVDIDEPTMTKE